MVETLETVNDNKWYHRLETVNDNEWYYKDCLISGRNYLDPNAKLTLVTAGGLRYKILLKKEDEVFTHRILTDLNKIEKSNGNSNTWIDWIDSLAILCSTLSAEEVIDSVTESLCKKCKKCESTNLVKCGLTKFRKQRWLCRGCGRKQTIV
jgi:hypothetical protein